MNHKPNNYEITFVVVIVIQTRKGLRITDGYRGVPCAARGSVFSNNNTTYNNITTIQQWI